MENNLSTLKKVFRNVYKKALDNKKDKLEKKILYATSIQDNVPSEILSYALIFAKC